MSWSAPMLIENLRYMSANFTVEVSEAGGVGREGGGGDVGNISIWFLAWISGLPQGF